MLNCDLQYSSFGFLERSLLSIVLWENDRKFKCMQSVVLSLKPWVTIGRKNWQACATGIVEGLPSRFRWVYLKTQMVISKGN